MAAPAAAATLRASEYPNIAFEVASAFELMTALVAEGTHAAALDAELQAYTDKDGNQPFDTLGTSITEAQLEEIVESRPQHGKAFELICKRYLYDFAL